jgi:hypothetical protein
VGAARLKSIKQICSQLINGEFEFSRHAFIRSVERNISEKEICQAAEGIVIIEDYPDDKYSPSCLVLGFTKTGRPLHLQVAYLDTEMVRIITLYEPEESEWIDYRQRR